MILTIVLMILIPICVIIYSCLIIAGRIDQIEELEHPERIELEEWK